MSSARARLGIDYLDAAPDPAPVIALRARLECDRAAGVAFSEAWRAATRAVLELDANGFELDASGPGAVGDSGRVGGRV